MPASLSKHFLSSQARGRRGVRGRRECGFHARGGRITPHICDPCLAWSAVPLTRAWLAPSCHSVLAQMSPPERSALIPCLFDDPCTSHPCTYSHLELGVHRCLWAFGLAPTPGGRGHVTHSVMCPIPRMVCPVHWDLSKLHRGPPPQMTSQGSLNRVLPFLGSSTNSSHLAHMAH